MSRDQYIRRLTEEYKSHMAATYCHVSSRIYNLYSSVPTNVLNYIHHLYIHRGIPRLTNEYNIVIGLVNKFFDCNRGILPCFLWCLLEMLLEPLLSHLLDRDQQLLH
jgi:hypothetical protein